MADPGRSPALIANSPSTYGNSLTWCRTQTQMLSEEQIWATKVAERDISEPAGAMSDERAKMNRDSWTVGDGALFVLNSRAGKARNPEERKLLGTLQKVQRKIRARHAGRSTFDDVHDSPSTPRSRQAEIAVAARSQHCMSSAVAYLRNLWLFDGRRDSASMSFTHGLSSPRSSPPLQRHIAAKPALGTLPSAVINALTVKKLHVVKAWLEVEKSPNASCHAGMTALHYAVLAAFDQAVLLLISHGACPDVRHLNGSTALLIATIRADSAAVATLITLGGDPNIPDNDNHTPMMVAARMGYVEILRILLEAGADQGAQDRHRHTALWYSVKYDRRAAATILRAARQEAEERGGARPAASGSSIIRDTCGHR